MNRSRCEREAEVTGAVRSSLWAAELSGHLNRCAACRETKLVTENLLRYASALQTESGTGAADTIWRRARAERQAAILKRATRPLVFMQTLSLAFVTAFATWLLWGVPRFNYRELLRGWDHGAAFAGAAIALACIAAGALYLIHEGKPTVHST
jgi:hypothetical protein